MQTLQKLVPNSSKTDKASMLDEVIDHLKQLQATVQMMNRMSSMMMPMAMPQLAQMSVMTQMAQMAQMAQMGLGMMNMAGPLAQPAYPGLTQPMMHPSTPFVPMQPWNAGADRQKQPAGAAAVPDAYFAFLACQAAQQNAQHQQQQSQPTGMEAYNRMMVMYQKLNQQQTQPGSSKE